MNDRQITRRALLGAAAAGCAAIVAGDLLHPEPVTTRGASPTAGARPSWRTVGSSKASPAEGHVAVDHADHVTAEPSAGSAAVAVAEPPRVLSGQVRLASLTVGPGQTVELDPNRSTTLTLTGNLVVHGVLRARPANPSIVHEIHFDGIDESRFVGGGMEVLKSDVGLWVMGAGRLDLVGTAREGWNRTGKSSTWRPGDEVLRAPVESGSYAFATHAPGTTVPTASFRGKSYPTEVFNLTRNVIVRGGAGTWSPAPRRTNGRAHVYIRSSAPQTIKFVEFRNLGPRKQTGSAVLPTDVVLGRYALHFHHCAAGSRGSIVEGVVGRDIGGPVFVPHVSDGITFRDCLSFRSYGHAYWWDVGDPTTDLLLERCAAFSMRSDPDFRGSVAGFLMGRGTNVVARDCVAVDSLGTKNASGFHWPAEVNHLADNVWVFEGCRAHNNQGDGMRVWQNDANAHVISNFVAFHNRNSGVDHGAYRNGYRYLGLTAFGNAVGGDRFGVEGDVVCAANSVGTQRFDGVSAGHLVLAEHSLPPMGAVEFHNAAIDSVRVAEAVDREPGQLILNCAAGFDVTRDRVVVDSIHPGTTIEVRQSNGTSFTVRGGRTPSPATAPTPAPAPAPAPSKGLLGLLGL